MNAIDPIRMTQCSVQTSERISPLVIHLQRWGFSEPEARGILADLPTFDGRIEWAMGSTRGRPDLTVHLVDAARLSGGAGGAVWNAMGPAESMRKARLVGAPALAFVLGAPHQLPERRVGCWVMSGARSLVVAATIFAHAALLSGDVGNRDDRVRRLEAVCARDRLCILHRVMAASPGALVASLQEVLTASFDEAVIAPERIYLATVPRAYEQLTAANPAIATRLAGGAMIGCGMEADIAVAYPWLAL